jgi:hypothetical protein
MYSDPSQALSAASNGWALHLIVNMSKIERNQEICLPVENKQQGSSLLALVHERTHHLLSWTESQATKLALQTAEERTSKSILLPIYVQCLQNQEHHSCPSCLILASLQGSTFVRLVSPAEFSQVARPLRGPGVGTLTPCAW